MVWCGITAVGNLAGLVLFAENMNPVLFQGAESSFKSSLVNLGEGSAFGEQDNIAFWVGNLQHGFTAGFHGRDSEYFQFDKEQPHHNNDE